VRSEPHRALRAPQGQLPSKTGEPWSEMRTGSFCRFRRGARAAGAGTDSAKETIGGVGPAVEIRPINASSGCPGATAGAPGFSALQ